MGVLYCVFGRRNEQILCRFYATLASVVSGGLQLLQTNTEVSTVDAAVDRWRGKRDDRQKDAPGRKMEKRGDHKKAGSL